MQISNSIDPYTHNSQENSHQIKLKKAQKEENQFIKRMKENDLDIDSPLMRLTQKFIDEGMSKEEAHHRTVAYALMGLVPNNNKDEATTFMDNNSILKQTMLDTFENMDTKAVSVISGHFTQDLQGSFTNKGDLEKSNLFKQLNSPQSIIDYFKDQIKEEEKYQERFGVDRSSFIEAFNILIKNYEKNLEKNDKEKQQNQIVLNNYINNSKRININLS